MGTRRPVDAVDDLRAEIRLANEISVLQLGTSALDDVDTSAIKTPNTRRRQERLNRVRASIRQGLGIEEDGDA